MKSATIAKRSSKVSKVAIAITLSTLFLVSCGKDPNKEIHVSESAVIIGNLDWKDISTIPSSSPRRKNANKVAKVDIPIIDTRCTGFLISKNVIMTNHHCIPNSSYAQGVKVQFKYETGQENGSAEDQKEYDCSELIGNDQELDYALLKCKGNPGDDVGTVRLATVPVALSSSIYIVQQNCDYYLEGNCNPTKKVSYGTVTAQRDDFTHTADTLGGSSGSPVFSRTTNQVVGIHHAGFGNNGMGRGIENYAVPMHKIVRDIKARFPDVKLGTTSGNSSGSSTSQYEPNNSLATAFNITNASTRIKEEVSSSSDQDYFVVNVVGASSLKVSITFKHAEGDLDLYLYTKQMKLLKKSSGTSSSEKVEMTLAPGKYIVKVKGYRGAQGKYELVIRQRSISSGGNSSGSSNGQSSSNNTRATATVIAQRHSSTQSISGSDKFDYYKVRLGSTKKLSVQIKLARSAGDLELVVYNTRGRIVAKSTSSKRIESISKVLKAGSYIIKVYGYRGATGSYEIVTF
ncbi:MAG: V8-like Glu-specific endopeptidase [Thermoproteota archaeon]|jgi:V8-like Glu-specific endopeptidase